MIVILLCILPLLSAQDAPPTTFSPKFVRSGDLPEDYHMATIASETSDLATKTTTLRDEAPTTEINPTESPITTNTSDVAASRSFIIDASDPEFNQDSTEPQPTTHRPENTTKPQKMKKKILISRTKSDRLSLDSPESRFNQTDSDLKKRSEDESTFYSFSSSTTEVSHGRQITSSLLITGIENNNLVIETSVRPEEQSTTSAYVDPSAGKNTIRFDSNDSTGQTDWVPVVAKKTDWFAPVTETTRRRRPSTSRPIRFPDEETSTEAVTEMDVAVWALATSQLTRRPINSSDVELVSFVSPPNNTIYKRIKENVLSRVTENPVENVTKEHNQVLKNTIPDSVVVETTPGVSKWRPVTVPPSAQNSTVSGNETTGEDGTDVERSMAYEIMKITTVLPANTSQSVDTTHDYLENQVVNGSEAVATTEKMENSTVIEMMLKLLEKTTLGPNTTLEPTTMPSTSRRTPVESTTISSTSIKTPVEPTTISSTRRRTTVVPRTTIEPTTMSSTSRRTTTVEPTTISSNQTENGTIVPMVLEILESSTTTNDPKTVAPMILEIVENSTKKAENVTVLPIVMKLLESIMNKTVDEVVTTPFDLPTTTEADAETTEYPEEKREKSNDDNRTILGNDTSVEFSVLDEITEENVPAYLRLTVKTSEIELCHLLPDLRTSILKILSEGTNTTVSSESLVLLNLNPTICRPVLTEDRPEDSQVRHRPVNMFLMDENGDFNKNLSEAFLRLWGEAGLDFPLPILKVDFVTPIPEVDLDPDMGSGVIAAIVISCVAGLCLILLGLLFVVMKRRQKKFNYGQRCTPVSLDAYSLDSVSIRNSSRRKGIRASKRSYGNAAFDDSEVPSHPVNFAGLANFSLEKEQLHEEFSIIPQVAPRPDELPPGAETRNRYANVIPLPETRVVLSLRDGEPHSDYINANFIKGLSSSDNLYIAAQAPLENTLGDWWRMVWEQQIKVVLMLTALQENGVEKCADYLPPNEVTDNLRVFGDYQVTLKKRDVKDKYIVSTLQLKNMENNLWREVTHLWYVGWPDSGVPSEPNSLIAFLIEARSQLKSSSGVPAPTLVHCSPGTGRTGTVIACDMLIREFEQKRLVDIPRAVYHLRRSRAGAVQTRDQYAFIYQVLNTYATKLTGGALENI